MANQITSPRPQGNTLPASVTLSPLAYNQLHLLQQQITIVTDEFNKGKQYCDRYKVQNFIALVRAELSELEPQLNTPATKPYFDSLQNVVADFEKEFNLQPNFTALFTKALLMERLLFSVVACLVPAFNAGGNNA